MEKTTLLATLKETLREVTEKLAQSDALMIRMREELATFKDILHHAKQREVRASQEYEKVFTDYRELLAASDQLPSSYPLIEKIDELSAEQARTHDEQLAAKEAARKYQEQVQLAELGLAIEESNHQSLERARDDLTWQIKRLSAAQR
jgi:lipid II:glycine glycyltransferase (peptidoglycan interpeptide bridge formation enzyme)